MIKLDLEKAEEPEIKLPTSVGSYKKQEDYRKTSISNSLTTLKPLTVWITENCGKFLKRWEYNTTLPYLNCGVQTSLKRRLLRVPWTARRCNQSILKEIRPGISLEGMMLS